jgi:hypothetical protein
MRRFLHFLVNGKMAAYQSVFVWIKQEPDKDNISKFNWLKLSAVWTGVVQWLVSSGLEAFHYNCLLLSHSCDIVPKLDLANPPPKNINITYPTDGLSFEHLFDSRCQMFPFHTLAFAFWSVIVDSRLVSSDNTSQNGVTVVMISVQLTLEDCHTVTLVFSCSCSGTHNAQTL